MEVELICKTVSSLSVLVIIIPEKWDKDEFVPNEMSTKRFVWFEGTGTVIGLKRNRAFILTSIHCIPTSRYSFFIKGPVSQQNQVPATLCINHFEKEDNGIDMAVLSCDAKILDEIILQEISSLVWNCPLSNHYKIEEPIWLVHYPNIDSTMTPTHRLRHPVHPDVAVGILLSIDESNDTFDSTIIASEGSSGGLVIDKNGHVLGIHDSQHDDNEANEIVSTHRMTRAVQRRFQANRQLESLLR